MTSDPITALELQLVNDPFGPDHAELLAVSGDLLLSRGDPRGELIALERAAATGQLADSSLAHEVRRWLLEHDSALASQAALDILRNLGFGLRGGGLGLRGGLLWRLEIDLRRSPQAPRRQTLTERTDALARALARSPTCRLLRELHVRVARDEQAETCLDRIGRAARGLPLEVLTVSATTRPIGHQTRADAVELRKHFPHLWLVTRFGRITPLIEHELDDRPIAAALDACADEACSRELRLRIGRGLTSGLEHATQAACRLIAGLDGAGEVFAPALELMLRPQVSHAAIWLLAELPNFGPWARRRLGPRVATITGDSRRYPADVRSLAGRCQRLLDRGV